jgi:hypothetical protein
MKNKEISTTTQAILDFKAGIAFAEEWIPISDKPTKGTLLLMYDNDPNKVVSGFVDKITGDPTPHWRNYDWTKITHYRPIHKLDYLNNE